MGRESVASGRRSALFVRFWFGANNAASAQTAVRATEEANCLARDAGLARVVECDRLISHSDGDDSVNDGVVKEMR
jgi:hypothetical protein